MFGNDGTYEVIDFNTTVQNPEYTNISNPTHEDQTKERVVNFSINRKITEFVNDVNELKDLHLDRCMLGLTEPDMLAMVKIAYCTRRYVTNDTLKILYRLLHNVGVDNIVRDKTYYCHKWLKLAEKILEVRLDINTRDINIILQEVFTNTGTDIEYMSHLLGDNVNLATGEGLDISEEDAMFYAKKFADMLKSFVIDANAMQMLKMLYAYYSYLPWERNVLFDQIQDCCNEIAKDLRDSTVKNNKEETFSLEHGIFEDKLKEYYEENQNPETRLMTGIQDLNRLLGGGFESGRLYTFIGVQGEGKSSTMLNMAIQIKKFNRGYRPKHPGYKPCVVILTMENSVKETVERMYNIAYGPGELVDAPLNDIIYRFRSSGLDMTEYDNIDIVVRYTPPNIETTEYCYKVYDELMADGKEPICFIQDYIERIRPAGYRAKKDDAYRLELGLICDEFKEFARVKEIPFITASQINRQGMANLDKKRNERKSNQVEVFTRDNVGESVKIGNNSDCMIFIAPEIDYSTGCKWLGFKFAKSRAKTCGRNVFYVQYERENEINLITDVGLDHKLTRDNMVVNGAAEEYMREHSISKEDNRGLAEIFGNTLEDKHEEPKPSIAEACTNIIKNNLEESRRRLFTIVNITNQARQKLRQLFTVRRPRRLFSVL